MFISCLGCISVTCCSPKTSLPAALEKDIIASFRETSPAFENKKLGILTYYGNFRETYVIRFSGVTSLPVLCCQDVGEVEIRYCDTNVAWSYFSGKIASLFQAYKEKRLTNENLQKIEDLQEELYPNLANEADYLKIRE